MKHRPHFLWNDQPPQPVYLLYNTDQTLHRISPLCMCKMSDKTFYILYFYYNLYIIEMSIQKAEEIW